MATCRHGSRAQPEQQRLGAGIAEAGVAHGKAPQRGGLSEQLADRHRARLADRVPRRQQFDNAGAGQPGAQGDALVGAEAPKRHDAQAALRRGLGEQLVGGALLRRGDSPGHGRREKARGVQKSWQGIVSGREKLREQNVG